MTNSSEESGPFVKVISRSKCGCNCKVPLCLKYPHYTILLIKEVKLISSVEGVLLMKDFNLCYIKYSIEKSTIILSFMNLIYLSLREKCPYSEFFQIRENTDQKKFEYGNLLRSVIVFIRS